MTDDPLRTYQKLSFARDNAAYCVVGSARAVAEALRAQDRFVGLANSLAEYDKAHADLKAYENSEEFIAWRKGLSA